MNNMIRGFGLVLASSLLLLLSGCLTPGDYGSASGVYGGAADDYRQQPPKYPSQYDRQVQGTVDGVDPGYSRISVIVDDPRSGRGQRVDVRYDQRTRLFYQGREQSLDGLERGDVIRMDVTQSGRELWASSIQVVRNVRDDRYGGDYRDDRYGGSYGNDLRGSVSFVDTRSRLIRLDGGGYGNNLQVAYDARTTVEYQGRRYRPENLQRGDSVRIQARQVGNNQWLAERIVVERSVGR